jgi:hypothetical protein
VSEARAERHCEHREHCTDDVQTRSCVYATTTAPPGCNKAAREASVENPKTTTWDNTLSPPSSPATECSGHGCFIGLRSNPHIPPPLTLSCRPRTASSASYGLVGLALLGQTNRRPQTFIAQRQNPLRRLHPRPPVARPHSCAPGLEGEQSRTVAVLDAGYGTRRLGRRALRSRILPESPGTPRSPSILYDGELPPPPGFSTASPPLCFPSSSSTLLQSRWGIAGVVGNPLPIDPSALLVRSVRRSARDTTPGRCRYRRAQSPKLIDIEDRQTVSPPPPRPPPQELHAGSTQYYGHLQRLEQHGPDFIGTVAR